jgi:hypothetical protein
LGGITANEPIGQFRLGDLAQDNTGGSMVPRLDLALTVTGYPVQVVIANVQRLLRFEWIELVAVAETTQVPVRVVGRLKVDDRRNEGYPVMAAGSSRDEHWLWELTAEDVEAVDNSRATNPSGDVYFSMGVRGLVRVVEPESGQLLTVCRAASGGTQNYRVPESDWFGLVRRLGFRTPASQESLVSAPTRTQPAWRAAEERLSEARAHLALGDDSEAVVACLGQLEAFVENAYDYNRWLPLLEGAGMMRQKAESIARLMSGVATWCNRVGHHRARGERDGAGDLLAVPLEHWEAELVVGISQLVLVYAERLRSKGVLPNTAAPAPAEAASDPTRTPSTGGVAGPQLNATN